MLTNGVISPIRAFYKTGHTLPSHANRDINVRRHRVISVHRLVVAAFLSNRYMGDFIVPRLGDGRACRE